MDDYTVSGASIPVLGSTRHRGGMLSWRSGGTIMLLCAGLHVAVLAALIAILSVVWKKDLAPALALSGNDQVAPIMAATASADEWFLVLDESPNQDPLPPGKQLFGIVATDGNAGLLVVPRIVAPERERVGAWQVVTPLAARQRLRRDQADPNAPGQVSRLNAAGVVPYGSEKPHPFRFGRVANVNAERHSWAELRDGERGLLLGLRQLALAGGEGQVGEDAGRPGRPGSDRADQSCQSARPYRLPPVILLVGTVLLLVGVPALSAGLRRGPDWLALCD